MVKRLAATELAKLGKCEKQLLLNNVYPDTRQNKDVEEKRLQGIEKHKMFEEENQRMISSQRNVKQYDTPADKRCYIATAVFGVSAPETLKLRKWRDDFLKNYYLGRQFINVYYKISPYLIRKSPHFLKPIARIALRGFIKIIGRNK